MRSHRVTGFVLLSASLVCGTTRADDKSEAELKRLAGFMAGSFSSKEQAAEDKAFFDVRLHMAPIWTDRKGEHWLYVEQAMAGALEKPYRQRVYKLVWKDGDPVSVVYTLPGDALKFAGAWKKPEVLAKLKPTDLTEREGCAIVLKKKTDGNYSGSTVGKGCASDLRGAKYATSEVTITADTLTSWDRGYDGAGKQVWGAVKGPYVFKKADSGR